MAPKSILKKRPAPVDDEVVEVPREVAAPVKSKGSIKLAVAPAVQEEEESSEDESSEDESMDGSEEDDSEEEDDEDDDEEVIRALAEGQPRPAKSASSPLLPLAM